LVLPFCALFVVDASNVYYLRAFFSLSRARPSRGSLFSRERALTTFVFFLSFSLLS